MWHFLKKKNSGTATHEVLPPFSKQFVEDIILACQGSATQFSLYYANMCGYLRDMVSQNDDSRFQRIIASEGPFTGVGRAYAVRRLTGLMDLFCASDAFERLVLSFNKCADRKYSLHEFKKHVSRNGFGKACSNLGVNLENFIELESVRRRKIDLDRIDAKLEERKAYLKPLLMRAQAHSKNKYGDSDQGEYIKEIEEFLSHYFSGTLIFYPAMPVHYCINYVESWFTDYREGISIPLGGIEFEHWCAARIGEQGWSVRVTKATGDQGIDLEATKVNKVIVIQCKRWDQPVGNGAVQEIYAGKAYHLADAACVIATCGFTPSAHELARNIGVVLLDAQTIDEFTDVIESRV